MNFVYLVWWRHKCKIFRFGEGGKNVEKKKWWKKETEFRNVLNLDSRLIHGLKGGEKNGSRFWNAEPITNLNHQRRKIFSKST